MQADDVFTSPLLQQNPDLAKVLQQCYLDTGTFGKTFMPERFSRGHSGGHRQIFDALDNDSFQKVVIAAPRGFGKSSWSSVAYPAKRMLFRDKKFVVPISCTSTQAVMQSEDLKRELVSNREIAALFGQIKAEGRENTFSKEMWETSFGAMVVPRGAGQQVRGIRYGRYRPDLIIGDDLEDPETVRSDEQRKKLKDWFFADVCNSVDRGGQWKIVVIGTVLHEDALLVNLLEDPSWHSICLSICDDELKSNWPEFISDDEVRKLYESLLAQGLDDTFFREYRNIPISTLNAVFKSDLFKYYEPSDLYDNKDITYYVIVDPAKTTKLQSADSAVVCWGLDKSKHRFFFHDCESGKFYPDELYDKAFKMVQRHQARVLAVEVTSLNEFITQPIKNEMRARGVFPTFVELKARDKKENRIAALAPYYRLGYVYHNRGVSAKLEQQLLGFPRSRLWDVMDAAAYVVELLEAEEDYFEPEGLDVHDDEAVYAELANESPVKNWRPV